MQTTANDATAAVTAQTSGAIQYAPRPAHVSEAPHSDQRRFGNDYYSAFGLRLNPGLNDTADIRLTVYRSAEDDHARLDMDIGNFANIGAHLTPADLREAARRLLDAAADIENNPAEMLLAQKRAARSMATQGGAA